MQDYKLASFPLQIWTGASPLDPEGLRPVRNRWQFNKPAGGLWTSSHDPETGLSDWLQWCIDNYESGLKSHLYILYPSPSVRIYTIDSYENLVELLRKHARIDDPSLLDFEALSSVYDAVHLTHKGIIETALAFIMGRITLYGWDAESTLWFRWCFDAVEALPMDRAIRSRLTGE